MKTLRRHYTNASLLFVLRVFEALLRGDIPSRLFKSLLTMYDNKNMLPAENSQTISVEFDAYIQCFH